MAGGGRTGSFLGIKGLEDVARMARSAEKSKVAVEGMKNTFIYWMGDDSGGAFTKKAANEFTKFLKEEVFKGEKPRKQYRFEKLTDAWLKRKADPVYWGGQTLDHRIGIATGQMMEAIRPIDQGGGLWRVGISNNAVVSNKIGNITKIADYAKILEFGSVNQTPRPVFSSALLDWANEHLPKLLRDSFVTKVTKRMNEVWKEMGERRPDNVPEGDPTIALYDESGGLIDVSSEHDTETEALRNLGKLDEEETDAPERDLEESGKKEYDEAEGFPESDRVENYIEMEWQGGTIYMLESMEYVWNWIDEMWQDNVTAFAKLKGYGKI